MKASIIVYQTGFSLWRVFSFYLHLGLGCNTFAGVEATDDTIGG